MNPVIESLNLGGARFVEFAWPMLWQSSVLIAILFALDFTLRRKVRAAVRYALWLVVLLKLLLPPTLAVPTSIAWWVLPNPPPKPQPRQYIVTYFDSAQTPKPENVYETFTAGALEIPQTRLSPAGWFVAASAIVSISLLVWMMLRWRYVARMIRAASPASQEWNTILDDGLRRIGLRRAVRLRMTDLPMSPAVCGLFRPVILLPRSLGEQLLPNQLRAVLLHELAHLKRGDVWVNCAQAVLQIAYWWHPLLWLANARIRRVREEAVDDAVMLALRDEAETYAPTLLEVAKLALNRPLASLGLVGIMESRSALRQRIERLASFSTPRKAGLTVMSALVIIVFSALAVPMEKAPAPSAKPVLPEISPASPISEKPAAVETNAAESVLNGRLLLDMGKLNDAEAEFKKALRLDPENRPAWYFLSLVEDAQHKTAERKALLPASANARPNVPSSNKSRQEMINKLERIRLDRVFFDNVPLDGVIRSLVEETKKRDPEGRGVTFILNPNPDQPSAAVIDPSTGLPAVRPYATTPELQWPQIKIKPALTNITLSHMLDIIVNVADKPIRYSIEHFGVVFSAGRTSEPLYQRQFKVEPQAFQKWLEHTATLFPSEIPSPPHEEILTLPGVDPREVERSRQPIAPSPDLPQRREGGGVRYLTRTNNMNEVHAAVRNLAKAFGVDLSPPKAAFYNDRAGILLVNATQADLDAIQRLLEKWNTTPPPAVVHKDKVPLLGDVPWIGKLFRSESNSTRVATNGASWLTELTNILTGPTPAPLAGRMPTAEASTPPTGPAATPSFPSNFLDPWGIPYNTSVPTTKTVRTDLALKGTQPQALRRFKVDATSFCQSLEAATGIVLGRMETNQSGTGGVLLYVRRSTSAEVTRAAEVFLKKLGVNTDLPGRSAFFQERTSELLVSATKAELDVITEAIQRLNATPPLVSIKVRFVEVPPPDASGSFDLFLRNLTGSNTFSEITTGGSASAMTVPPKIIPGVFPQVGGPATTAQQNGRGQMPPGASASQGMVAARFGILTDPQYRQASRALEQQEGVELLNAPEVLTRSGQQAQIQIANLMTIMTGVTEVLTNAATNIVYKTEKVPCGTTIDVIPRVQPDGRTISLTLIPTVTEFLGYDDPGAFSIHGGKPQEQMPLPRFRVRQTTTSVEVLDGRTVVLMNFPDQEVTRQPDGSETQKPFKGEKRRDLIVFVTPTIIDAAGNPLHPPQPTSR